MTEREELHQYISDAFKDVNGFRPRHFDCVNMPMDDLRKLADDLEDEVQRSIQCDLQRDEEAIAAYEQAIVSCMNNGAQDRATAVRWLKQAVDADSDDWFRWEMGLPNNYQL